MRYLALATDYDGTLAHDGVVSPETIAALERLRATGRRLILVTGRELPDLMRVFPRLDLFDRVVAENGALTFCPDTRAEQTLGEVPPEAFVAALRERRVTPLSVGRVIVATWHPNERMVLETIRDLGLELQVIFNKGAVMILPPGINKAAGLSAALKQLDLSPHNVVGIGDAENDHAFMNLCEASAAVANALPMLKERADYLTVGDHGAGVVELIDMIIANDLADLEPKLDRHQILLGTLAASDEEIRLRPYGANVLLSGSSGSGKSTLATAILERLAEQQYQFCIIDPEGDYETFEGAVVLGDSRHEPGVHEIMELLEQPDENVSANMLGIKLADRPAFFEKLLPRIQELRSRTGRPHWLVIDEAHHLLPTSWRPSSETLPQATSGLLLITVHPDHVAPPMLTLIDTILAVGEAPEQALRSFAAAVATDKRAVGEASRQLLDLAPVKLAAGEALVWSRGDGNTPFKLTIAPSYGERRRHLRKYAEGNLGEDKSFFFRGPDGKLNLRAQNLNLFNQIAEGVDEATWLHHLRQGDYSGWFREAIKDEALAQAAAEIERRNDVSAAESRAAIKTAIEERYTAPD
jgi:hydroxymethylpyrimidine pyrophosphatase-like HAD family hydrolase